MKKRDPNGFQENREKKKEEDITRLPGNSIKVWVKSPIYSQKPSSVVARKW